MNSDFLEQDLIQNGFEEKVTVNQRALIDKLLARYKGQFTVFRELIQNADDAKAAQVAIKLYKANRTKPVLVVQNDGEAFSETDWKRLIKIAEGNPNEEAIGCFGVGFYSVFSITENPIVSSNGQNLVFVWKDDQLTTFRNASTESKTFSGLISEAEKSWTHFIFQLRDDDWAIDTLEFSQFLCQTLAFTQRAQSISYYIDDDLKFRISRNTKQTESLKLSKSFRGFSSPNNIFKLKQCDRKVLEFTALYENTEQVLFLDLLEGTVTCSEDKATKSVEAQMLRILGKKFPSQSKIRILLEISNASEKPIFKDLTPYPTKGRIFIGFSSHQTSGLGAHIACQLIPTVERENIDFSDVHFNKWNSDLVYTSGAILRLFYNKIMGPVDFKEANCFTETRMELMKALAFKSSTPAGEVTTLLKKGFFCDYDPLVIPSNAGMTISNNVYLPFKDMETFTSLPVVPSQILSQVEDFFRVLVDQKLIYEITFKMMIDSLHTMTLTEDQLVDILQWFMAAFKDKQLVNDVKKLKRNFLESVNFSTDKQILLLSNVKYFADKDYNDLPIPFSALPFSIATRLGEDKLMREPLSFARLPFNEWWSFTKDLPALENPVKSVSILEQIARKWSGLSPKDHDSIVQLLEKKKCILAENQTMQIPSETYISHVTLFENLNFVSTILISKLNPKFLQDIGVRSTPDVKLVFKRLAELDWNLKTLIDFLINNETTFDDDDWKFLKSQKFLPVKGVGTKAVANQLHFPDEPVFEALGLPLLDWIGKLSPIEKSFLMQIGVKEHPTLNDILKISSSQDIAKREISFKYLLDNFDKEYKKYYKTKEVDFAFIPTTDGLSKIGNCFHGNMTYSPEDAKQLCYYLGCYQVLPEFRTRVKKLGVQEHPPIYMIVNKLNQTPPKAEIADIVFDYVNKYQSEISGEQWKVLKHASFIPYENGFLSPNKIFLFSSEIESKYGNLLDYVKSFSTTSKNFLMSCGCVTTPTPNQLADALIKNHRRFLESCGTTKYIHVLDEIAQSWDSLAVATRSKLVDTPCMLGTKLSTQNGETTTIGQLALARECYLIDNTDYQRVFNVLSAASTSTDLDRMYEALGSSWLTNKIKEKSTEMGQGKMSEKAKEIEELIVNRKGLLLNDINTCTVREGLKKNADSLLQGLKVFEVNKIKKELTLGNNKREIESVICTKMNNTNQPVIYVTSNIDILQVASELATILLVKKGKEDTLKFAALLQISISSLRQQGYPIDRLLPQNKKTTATPTKAAAAPNVPIIKQEEVKYSKHEEEDDDEEEEVTTTTTSQASTTKNVTKTISDFKRIDDMVTRAIKTTPGSVAEKIIEVSHEIIETRCESRSDRDLARVGTVNGLAVYEERGITAFTEDMMDCGNSFATILKHLAQVFNVKHDAVRIFLENSNATIAFNLNGGLHFNLLYYQKLHYLKKDVSMMDVYFFWYSTFCHELAHNIVSSHNEEHSFLTEHMQYSYFKQLFPQLMQMANQTEPKKSTKMFYWF